MSKYDLNELIQLKTSILQQKNNVRNDPLLIKDLNCQYSRIQMKIKYYSDDDYRKAKCNASKLFNTIHSDSYNTYEINYKKIRNRNIYKE
jgi:hypothetical protein